MVMEVRKVRKVRLSLTKNSLKSEHLVMEVRKVRLFVTNFFL